MNWPPSSLKKEKLVARADTEVQACQTEIGQELDQLKNDRTQAEQDIPVDVRTVFNRMADMHEGEGMAPVSEVSRRNREYLCDGCYMSIPVERVNALIIQQDTLVLCPSCNRILYIDQELKASIGSNSCPYKLFPSS